MDIISKYEKYGVGTKHITNEGYEIEVVEKINRIRRRIIFEDGYEIKVKCSNIGAGTIKNPYHSSVFSVGYLGVGEYKAQIKGKQTPEYGVWTNMLGRCYDEKYQEKYPTYKGVSVCKEWHDFQNFADFYHKNNPKIDGVKFQLDKDLLQQYTESKIYSPETCIFLPCNVNGFLANKQSNNTSGYIGVSWAKHTKKWQVRIKLFGEGKEKYLGCFATPEEASEAYQSVRKVESEKVKEYLRSLNYLSEEIIQLVK